GSLVAVANESNKVLLWEIATGKPRKPIEASGRVAFLAFAPDGRTLAAATRQRIDLWDVASGRWARQVDGPACPLLALAFAPDGRALAMAWADESVWLSETLTGKL